MSEWIYFQQVLKKYSKGRVSLEQLRANRNDDPMNDNMSRSDHEEVPNIVPNTVPNTVPSTVPSTFPNESENVPTVKGPVEQMGQKCDVYHPVESDLPAVPTIPRNEEYEDEEVGFPNARSNSRPSNSLPLDSPRLTINGAMDIFIETRNQDARPSALRQQSTPSPPDGSRPSKRRHINGSFVRVPNELPPPVSQQLDEDSFFASLVAQADEEIALAKLKGKGPGLTVR